MKDSIIVLICLFSLFFIFGFSFYEFEKEKQEAEEFCISQNQTYSFSFIEFKHFCNEKEIRKLTTGQSEFWGYLEDYKKSRQLNFTLGIP